MNNRQKEMLIRIMAEEFTAIELNLFLDTHPLEKKALSDYIETVKRLNFLKKKYEEDYGPLTNFGYAPSDYQWQWIEEPWPWEINFADMRGER